MGATHIKTHSPEETTKLAVQLSAFLEPGDVLILTGDLAAGKTHFVKSIVDALGSDASVSSPTYTIAHHYPTAKMPVLHIDAYRLSGPQEFRDLTLEDYYDQSLICVEWGDIIDGVFSTYIRFNFNFGKSTDTQRNIEITHKGDRWSNQFDKLMTALKEVTS